MCEKKITRIYYEIKEKMIKAFQFIVYTLWGVALSSHIKTRERVLNFRVTYVIFLDLENPTGYSECPTTKCKI